MASLRSNKQKTPINKTYIYDKTAKEILVRNYKKQLCKGTKWVSKT